MYLECCNLRKSQEDINLADNLTFAQSLKIDERLLKYFPLGTPSLRLLDSLLGRYFSFRVTARQIKR